MLWSHSVQQPLALEVSLKRRRRVPCLFYTVSHTVLHKQWCNPVTSAASAMVLGYRPALVRRTQFEIMHEEISQQANRVCGCLPLGEVWGVSKGANWMTWCWHSSRLSPAPNALHRLHSPSGCSHDEQCSKDACKNGHKYSVCKSWYHDCSECILPQFLPALHIQLAYRWYVLQIATTNTGYMVGHALRWWMKDVWALHINTYQGKGRKGQWQPLTHSWCCHAQGINGTR